MCATLVFFFFFQAEDGIRDLTVTGVQTCALPIYDIAARMFSRRESEAYRALDPSDKPLAFFSCWTRKEAFIKALGDGLSHPLDRFDVSFEPGEPARILRVDSTPGDRCGWTLYSFLTGPGLIGAIVAQKAIPGTKREHN